MLVLINGAYGKRFAKLTEMMGRRLTTFETADDVPTTADDVDQMLAKEPSITHVGLIHCETSTGIHNPLAAIAEVVARHGKGLIVDAMSSFGALPIDARATPFDALIAASGKCVEGPPGMGFVLVRNGLARTLRGQFDVVRTGPGRPVGVHGEDDAMAIHAADARRRRAQCGARPVHRRGRAARAAWRATRQITTTLDAGMRELGFKPFLDPAIQAPIIVTFHAPADPRAYAFKEFYDRVRDKGFILYPGKLTQLETFRVGCIGAIGPDEMRHAVNAVRDTLLEMGIKHVAPAHARRAAA